MRGLPPPWVQGLRVRSSGGDWTSEEIGPAKQRTVLGGALCCDVPWHVSRVVVQTSSGEALHASRHAPWPGEVAAGPAAADPVRLSVGDNLVWVFPPAGGASDRTSAHGPVLLTAIRAEVFGSLWMVRNLEPHERALVSFWSVLMLLYLCFVNGIFSAIGSGSALAAAALVLSRIGLECLQRLRRGAGNAYNRCVDALAGYMSRDQAHLLLLFGVPASLVLLLMLWFLYHFIAWLVWAPSGGIPVHVAVPVPPPAAPYTPPASGDGLPAVELSRPSWLVVSEEDCARNGLIGCRPDDPSLPPSSAATAPAAEDTLEPAGSDSDSEANSSASTPVAPAKVEPPRPGRYPSERPPAPQVPQPPLAAEKGEEEDEQKPVIDEGSPVYVALVVIVLAIISWL